jgi:hypothetical protein
MNWQQPAALLLVAAVVGWWAWRRWRRRARGCAGCGGGIPVSPSVPNVTGSGRPGAKPGRAPA